MVYSLLALEIAIEIFFYLLRDLIAAVVENSFPPVEEGERFLMRKEQEIPGARTICRNINAH